MATEHAPKEYTSIPKEAPEQVRTRAAYASFGNEGLTATANARGRLLQITRYFGEEEKNPSGFVCVEFDTTPPPYFIVDRLAHLESHTKSFKTGMCFDFADSPWAVNRNILQTGFLRDRWPRFITTTQLFDVDIEYRIYKGTVYQVYTYKKKPEAPGIPPLEPQQTIHVEPTFRHLDFSINDQNLKHEYTRETNKKGDVFRISIKAERGEERNMQTTACLCISLFVNGCAQKLSIDAKTMRFTVDLSDLQKNGEIQIALAYTLNELSSENEDVDKISPVAFTDYGKILEESGAEFEGPSFTEDAHLNFALRRNLEHILSVCSIPVAESSTVAESPAVAETSAITEASAAVAFSDEIPLIALTCGDISGHRISTAASFYAFQVLLQASSHFSKKAKTSCKTPQSPCKSYNFSAASQDLCGSYDCYMRSRIWKVCYGHVKWVYKILQRDKDEKSICPHYWASGEAIKGWESHSFLRGISLADTPFHIIKVAEFHKIAGEEDMKAKITQLFRPIILRWVKKLDKRNKQGKYAFPHFREKPTHIFYFSDHVMIWRGLKSAEDLGMTQDLKSNFDPEKNQGRKLSYTSAMIRTNILKRFTAKNRLSNQRMLTVLQSPPETKFFLRLEDTVLFDAANLGLFEKSIIPSNENEWNNKIDLWKNMINFQIDQIGNESIDWIHPLQFALAMMMSAKDCDIDSRYKDQMIEMFEYSKSVLLESSSCNGLFPGQLDENKEPVLFSEELRSEDYWYTAFELPYILWAYQSQPKDASGTPPPDIPGKGRDGRAGVPQHLRSTTLQETSNTQYQEGYTMTKNTPFDYIIDTRNIAEYTDEWMYNEPKFFSHEYKSSIEEFRSKDPKNTHERVMEKFIGDNTPDLESEVKGYLIDVPKSKSLWDKDKQTTEKVSEKEISKTSDIEDFLKKKRLLEEAKKRFIHFYDPNRETALICYLASSEPDEMSTFFQRHALYEKYFFDEITPILNTWETELHLSFYRIVEANNLSNAAGISPPDRIEFPHSYQHRESKWISRAAMSFRFDGDVFDRYWTCHFFECRPQRTENEPNLDTLGIPRLETAKNSSKEHPWKQRQVLELLLFDEILKEILQGTEDILKIVKREGLRNPMKPSASAQTISPTSPLSDPLDLFREINGDVFDSTTQLWRKLHHILQVVEDDLSENLTNIGHFKNRQAGRELNRPRWTLKDERGYRSAISKLLASNNQQIIKLERCRADIESFKTLLSKRLEITREDLDLRRANDLRLFTYVTVVFLPISFATGVFSMSDAPTAGLVSSMATTATVALLVTVVALFSAKTLEAYIARPLMSIFRRVIYDPIIDPCVYFLARYLFIPLYNLLPDNILPQGSVRSILERLMKIGAISEAWKDFKQSKDKGQENDKRQGEKSAISEALKEFFTRLMRLSNKRRQENLSVTNVRLIEEALPQAGSFRPLLSQSSNAASSVEVDGEITPGSSSPSMETLHRQQQSYLG